jgi:hypothetical protein
MPKILFCACSQLVSVDRYTNTLSLFQIIEQVNAGTFPLRLPELFISSLWKREDGDAGLPFESIVRFIDPAGHIKGEWKAEWAFAQPRHRHILLIPNVEFDSPGTYRFDTYIKKRGDVEIGGPVSTIEIVAQQVQ